MRPDEKTQGTSSIPGGAALQPAAVTVPTSAVPLELLRRYSSPKPVRRPPAPEPPAPGTAN
jgi:hypothetical protein